MGFQGGAFNGLYDGFIDEIETINECKAIKFGFFLGDVVAQASNKNFKLFKDDLLLFRDDIDKYVIPGNHDVGIGHDNSKRDIFIQNFGKTYQSFEYKKDLFILLDANYDSWNIEGKQLEWLKKIHKNGNKYRNIFVFTHQVIWLDNNSNRGRLARVKTNSLEGYPKHGTTNFWPEIFPLISSLGSNSYFFSGDVGAFDNNSELFYDKHQGSHFFATGMGGGKRDNYLAVLVVNGDVKIIPKVF
ncbi:metallophosphoesterase [Candidatus Woesearchaeota archaeon]|nr:metallophosphoesterase [Candidatus Woesearchaeota archaeon]